MFNVWGNTETMKVLSHASYRHIMALNVADQSPASEHATYPAIRTSPLLPRDYGEFVADEYSAHLGSDPNSFYSAVDSLAIGTVFVAFESNHYNALMLMPEPWSLPEPRPPNVRLR